MRTRTRGAALTAASMTATLLLTGCGSDDGDNSDQPIDGAQEATPEPDDEDADETDTDTDTDAEPDDSIDRPDIELPDDVINTFEEVDTDDPVELAILADQENHINAVDEAITSGETDRPALPFYTAGDALWASLDYISAVHDDNISFAGTTRYYNREVDVREEGMATTTYCVDPIEVHTFDLETGEQTPDPGDKYLYSARLEKDNNGVWQTAFYTGEKGAEECP